MNAPIELQIFEGNKLLGSSLSERIMVGAGRHELEMVNDALGYRAGGLCRSAPARCRR